MGRYRAGIHLAHGHPSGARYLRRQNFFQLLADEALAVVLFVARDVFQ